MTAEQENKRTKTHAENNHKLLKIKNIIPAKAGTRGGQKPPLAEKKRGGGVAALQQKGLRLNH